MIVGVLKEIKNNENRIALTPDGAKELVEAGHTVLMEKNGGVGSGFSDDEYAAVGAEIVDTPKEICDKAGLVLKVKEPLPEEFDHFNEKQILFTYLHYASGKELTDAMLERKITTVAYETVEDENKGLPLLLPMSQVAGQMATLMGAYYLAKPHKGKGVLISNVPNTKPSKTLILGGGVVGENALMNAHGLRGDVVLAEINEERMKELEEKYSGIRTIQSTKENIEKELEDTDLLVGAVLVPGGKAPTVVSREMVGKMKPGSVIVDVAVDQGGCVETTKATSHSDPVYEEEGVTHYCVANMPGAYPRTSTIALTTATLPYVKKLAEKGLEALKEDEGFLLGLNTHKGKITYKGVAEAFGMEYVDPKSLL